MPSGAAPVFALVRLRGSPAASTRGIPSAGCGTRPAGSDSPRLRQGHPRRSRLHHHAAHLRAGLAPLARERGRGAGGEGARGGQAVEIIDESMACSATAASSGACLSSHPEGGAGHPPRAPGASLLQAAELALRARTVLACARDGPRRSRLHHAAPWRADLAPLAHEGLRYAHISQVRSGCSTDMQKAWIEESFAPSPLAGEGRGEGAGQAHCNRLHLLFKLLFRI